MSYKPLEVHDASKDLPLKWYQAQPVVTKRILSWIFEPVSTSEVHIVITGNSYNYRDDLEKAGFGGARDGSMYYRYAKGIDVSTTDGKQQILSLIDIFGL